MRKRKLYLLLALMNEEDLEGFVTFLSSPMFNNSKTLLRFFGYWRSKVLEQEEGAELTVEEFLEGTDISVGRMDKLSSQLNSKVMEFLALRAFQENTHAQEEMLMAALEKRKLGATELRKHYDRIRKGVEKEKESSEKRLHLLRLQKICARVAASARDTQALWREDFRELHELLDQYYQTEKLVLASASQNIVRIYKHDTDEMFPGQAYLDRLRGTATIDQLPQLAKAYFWSIEMLAGQGDGTEFDQLLQLLGSEASTFSRAHAGELYGYALNYCIGQINLGKLEFMEATSTIYLQLLDNGLMFIENMLPPKQFKNIIVLQCRLGKLAWVREFIDTYGARLPEDKRAAAIQYNEAVLSFYQQDYSGTIQQFKAVIAQQKDDVFYGIDARAYLWKSYYENLARLSREEVDEMYRLYDAFRVFIDRNEKIAAAHKEHYRNFIRAFKRFLEIMSQAPIIAEHLSALREEVLSIGSISDKGYILRKIDQALAGSGPQN